MPSPVRAFISFDFENDAGIRDLLVGQSKNPDSPFEIHDWSVREPFTDNWKEKVRARIRQTDVVIVLCGEHTKAAKGVDAELQMAQDERKPYFLLKGYSAKTCYAPPSAETTDKLYNWTWDNLKLLIQGRR